MLILWPSLGLSFPISEMRDGSMEKTLRNRVSGPDFSGVDSISNVLSLYVLTWATGPYLCGCLSVGEFVHLS